MIDTVTRYLSGVVDGAARLALYNILAPMADRYATKQLNSAGLVRKAGASPTVKTGTTACHAICQGILRSIGGSIDMAALSGTVVNATFNVYVFYVDSAGALTSAMGTAGATLAAVLFPVTPVGKAVIGFTIINPTGTGNFVGGTTALDDATVVPNAVHVSVVGTFDPSVRP